MEQLPVFLNLVGKPVILIGNGEAADAKRRLIERAGGLVTDEANSDARVAIVALDDEAEAGQAVARLRARGILVNAVDRPALCDFTLPAIVDRDPVLIAIGTGGASAGLAKALRQRLEAMFPVALGRLAQRLKTARDAMRQRWPDAAERRRAIDQALGQGGALDPLRDHADDAVGAWLSGPERAALSGIFEIGLVSGDPDDLSLRQLRLLGSADRVLHAPDVASAVLDRARADAAREQLSDEPVLARPGEVIVILRRVTAGNS
ncbi:MAG: NAD(P)-dependent oxidoreductase [Blastomonas sp.]